MLEPQEEVNVGGGQVWCELTLVRLIVRCQNVMWSRSPSFSMGVATNCVIHSAPLCS